jgi:hypothetical protein
MKKHQLTLIGALLLGMLSPTLKAQDFVGFNSHPYAGVSAIDVNPASIAGTVYKADINVVGADVLANNNYLKFNPKAFFKWNPDNKEKSVEIDPTGVLSNTYVHTKVQLPSFMLDLNYNDAVAFTWQVRGYAQIENAGKELTKLAYEDFDYTNYHNNTYKLSDMSIRMLNWSEIGLGYAHVFYLNGGNRVKVGTRLKYLVGLNALYMETNDISYLFQNDHVVNVDGSVMYAHSDNIDENIGFNPSGSGFGFDLGVKYSHNNQFILGASLLDFGGIKYTRAAESTNFTINQQNWDLNLENVDNVADFDAIIAQRGVATTSAADFKVGLPTTLSLQATANLWESGDFEGGGYQNLYVNVITYLDLSSMNSGKDVTMKPVNMTSATFGFVSIPIGAGIPVSFGKATGFNVGAFVRLGPFVMGSRNFVTSLFAKEVRDANVYAALKIPLLKPKPKIVQGCPDHF